MDSMPPATTSRASPATIWVAASITLLRPDPQTLLIVVQGTLSGMPARSDAWRAGAWPTPAWITLPMKTSSTSPDPTRARSAEDDGLGQLLDGTRLVHRGARPLFASGRRSARGSVRSDGGRDRARS